MKCNEVMTNFLGLDNGKSIPWRIRFHVLFCSDCRKEIFNLKKNFDSLEGESLFQAPPELAFNIMKNIELLQTNYEHNISIVRWVGVGLILLASLFLISFSNSLNWAKGQFGGNLEIPLSIIMGLAITVYSAIFIGTHTREFSKITDWIEKKLQ